MAGVVREAEAACDQEQLEITQQVPTGVPAVIPTGVCPRLVFCGLLSAGVPDPHLPHHSLSLRSDLFLCDRSPAMLCADPHAEARRLPRGRLRCGRPHGAGPGRFRGHAGDGDRRGAAHDRQVPAAGPDCRLLPERGKRFRQRSGHLCGIVHVFVALLIFWGFGGRLSRGSAACCAA